jgi:uncharacterized RDD family membrane protein YckC
MVVVMNAIAQASTAPVTGPKLDNRRVAAGIVDLLIVAAGAAVVLFAGDALTSDGSGVRGALGFVILGWALYYFFATESGEGQTVGKKLMKLRVVRADGRPASMAEIAVRTILRVVDNYLVGLIVMLATGEKRQRIGDLAAGTIVVDASVAAVPAPAPVADAAEDAEEDEPVADEDVDPVATETITLPARPEPPATLSDLAEPEAEAMETPEAPPVPEMRPFPPVDEQAEEAAAEQPAVETESEPVAVETEPAVEIEPEPVAVEIEPAVEDEVVAEEPVVEVREDELPPVTSPSLKELAQDVAAAHAEAPVEEAEPDVEEADPVEEASADDAPEEPEDDGPVTVKSVETVSAMDLIMGAAEADAAEESTPDSAQDAEDPSSA